ncbi:Uncharacterised protein [uncultured Butyricicoccus sp.]|nr:Uncharacterised protein [uncultured Butyricicoccus sp.]
MLIAVLLILTGVCAIGWFAQYVSTASLLWYLQEKNCPFPTQEESRKGSQFVVERIIKDFFGGKR